jgi:hypothetical protein
MKHRDAEATLDLLVRFATEIARSNRKMADMYKDKGQFDSFGNGMAEANVCLAVQVVAIIEGSKKGEKK